ncbi:23S rRNA (uracil(1939)-C(5))-methyltransferase RlmD [Olsenella massiliensis]|uniref:23S rRNA (uracil(1939)-C(5))-methyltransferase RlmD n=1 Tax=Olsenella massiliensis TaxID=1622075 RepID=UPI001F33981A|nr:23S rRNA (uracil(1939)-C(5))-methyltransferase RlmD [Olsenella massiliensis]
MLHDLAVERLSYGADAVAHAKDGRTAFVAGGVPGDVVDARVTQDHGRFLRTEVQRVVSPSPARIEPPCPLVGVCGGCPWGRLSPERQLDAKRANVVDALTRIGGFAADAAEGLVDSCVAPSDPWGYRNKVELVVARQGGRTTVGMHDVSGRQVVRVKACPLFERRHASLVKSVSGALSYLVGSRDLGVERLGIRASGRTDEVELALWTEPGPFPRAQVAKVLQDAARLTSIVRVLTKGPRKARKVVGVERLAGKGSWGERIGDTSLRVSAPSFFQVNTKGAETLVKLVLEGLSPSEDDVAMDLYCGAGTFTLPLARRVAAVDAVESYGPAVRDLRRNLELAGLDNVEAIGGDAGREFPDSKADLIVVDPPRAGLDEDVVTKLSKQPARAIAYVSCDPATLARDLARFREHGSFAPVRVTPVDLFPQTFHVETVCLMSRRD